MPGWGTILSLFSNALALFRKVAEIIATSIAKQAGRDEANADTLRQNAERTAKADEIGREADRIHRENSDNDDKAFDTSFRRD